MRIYTRQEWGARPPKKVMRHYSKVGFLIHHTASGHNTPQSEAKDLQYQYDCQGWHMRDHDGSDIFQGVTIFPSGRIVEGRMPWDTDNGAIYNWGGGAVDYLGIENDGTFDGERYMGNTQYASLVWFCAEMVQRGIVPVNFEVVGHRQVYPCRPGDPKQTGCPGNLLAQFVLNNKLKQDVEAFLKPEEDEMGLATWAEKITKGGTSQSRTWIDKATDKTLWVNVSNLGQEPTTIRYFGWRWNGAGMMEKPIDVDLAPKQKFVDGLDDGDDKDAAEFFGDGASGITLTVECIEGGPVQVEWSKTL